MPTKINHWFIYGFEQDNADSVFDTDNKYNADNLYNCQKIHSQSQNCFSYFWQKYEPLSARVGAKGGGLNCYVGNAQKNSFLGHFHK